MAVPLILSLLTAAPKLLELGLQLFGETTGEALPASTPPEDLAARIEALPPEQRDPMVRELMRYQEALQTLDTQRFCLLTDGDAAKVAATARPEIARQAMHVVTLFARGISWLFMATIAEWLARLICAAAGWEFPAVSLWELIAKAAPVSEMIWAPLLGSFAAASQIVLKYMGVRERDKAQQYEILAGRPLSSAGATIEAAGGAIAAITKAWRR